MIRKVLSICTFGLISWHSPRTRERLAAARLAEAQRDEIRRRG